MRQEVNYMERNAAEIIQGVVNKDVTKQKASVALKCSIRTINRKIQKFKNEGVNGFVHKNCNKPSNQSLSEMLKQKIIKLRKEKYHDFSYQHFWEKLEKDEQIKITYKTLVRLLEEHFLVSPYIKRATKKKLKLKLEEKTKQNPWELETLLAEEILDNKTVHPLQPRKEFFGECVQTDASIHNWIPDEKWALHAFIEEATGMVLSAYFDKQETFYAYYMVSKQMFLTYGTPVEILTDKRTVFYSTAKIGDPSESKTQYGFMCNQLGIALTTTSVAQTKGKIERLWQSFQRRLPQEFRINNIQTIEQANEYIKNFIEKYNQIHAIKLDETKNKFIEWSSHNLNIDFALSMHYTRLSANGATIKFENKHYATYDRAGNRINLARKQEIMVIRTFDGNLYANFYVLVEVDKKAFSQENIMSKAKKIEQTKTNNNRWKNSNWIYFKKKQNETSPKHKFSI
ncbi:ISNCY family transposase [Williamsoniiplasma luminosum]|uniref:Transposase n=1 Tax=Williamsoniiplasma luminosum TaxID=214888 RepID=A0A2S0NJ20_9MOLU|nr:ISNCY family transposase [Williamsoniiplasma luminosum]AVP49006.1 MAG: transposase [Williamsoniiplasma luminosum]